MKKVNEFKDLTDFISDKFLAVNNCGFTRCKTEQTVLRSKGRKDYHIIYVTKGRCVVSYQEKEEIFQEGSILFYKPYERQCYSYEKGSEACWAHFTGTAAEEFVAMLDVNKTINAGMERRLTELFNGIINNFEVGNNNLLSISYLMQFCAEAKKLAENNKIADMRIEKVKNYMNENYSKNHSLAFYAKMCNLSTARFSHLFKAETGVSPHRYLLGIRLRQVKYLLVYSNMNIKEIAIETGFEDPLYMSRFFSKYEGVSPKEYTQNHRI